METTSRTTWILTQEAFDELLSWLNSDRETAAKKYEDIRNRLIRIFVHRGCPPAEDLADRTINKVARKVHQIKEYYVGDPALYFCGVARNVYAEYLKTLVEVPVVPEITSAPVPEVEPDDSEAAHNCLDSCLQTMKPKDRELLLTYYREERGAKIDLHKEMSRRLGISVNALRIVICRLRASFKKCMQNCIKIEQHETNQ